MWRVQAIPHLVFEFLPRYRSFQVELEGAEVKGALIAQGSRELTLDVTSGGKRHGKRKDGVIDAITAVLYRSRALKAITCAERSSPSSSS